MKVILYSTGCPKCNVLTNKLNEKEVKYEIVNDIEVMAGLGISQVPVLSIDSVLLPFNKAIGWVNNLEVAK
ncbi:MAG: hypothetical protein II453_17825 [Alphaproteobacteria bacterium]|nr:hypothetical protein [Alphaproteobacteria bacterium]